tara:strand:- start:1881 stop:2183 length:303 start_codon:yes stop_codon:yes gene_type:complete
VGVEMKKILLLAAVFTGCTEQQIREQEMPEPVQRGYGVGCYEELHRDYNARLKSGDSIIQEPQIFNSNPRYFSQQFRWHSGDIVTFTNDRLWDECEIILE